MKLDENYWSGRYNNRNTRWDAGAITTPLKEYFDQLKHHNLKILIPGCGNAYEAKYLHDKGFNEVYIADISAVPLESFKASNPDFPEEHILHEDFFKLKGSFDIIVEQTFFCSLSPELRPVYAKKAYELLKPGGKLVGVLFDDPLNADRPPFGGNPREYRQYFQPYFTFQTYERCYNSIKPREGREWFIILEKVKS